MTEEHHRAEANALVTQHETPDVLTTANTEHEYEYPFSGDSRAVYIRGTASDIRTRRKRYSAGPVA